MYSLQQAALMTPIPSATDMIKSCPGSFLRHFICFFSPRLVAEIPFSSGTRFWFSFFMSRIQLLDNLWYSILSHISQSYVQLFSVSFVRFLHIWCWLRGLLSQSRLRLWIALGWIQKQRIYIALTLTSVLHTANPCCAPGMHLCI